MRAAIARSKRDAAPLRRQLDLLRRTRAAYGRAREHAPHNREMAFVFDDHPERKKGYQAAYDVFSGHAEATATPSPRLSRNSIFSIDLTPWSAQGTTRKANPIPKRFCWPPHG